MSTAHRFTIGVVLAVVLMWAPAAVSGQGNASSGLPETVTDDRISGSVDVETDGTEIDRRDDIVEVETDEFEYVRYNDTVEFQTTDGVVDLHADETGVDLEVNGKEIEQIGNELEFETSGVDFDSEGLAADVEVGNATIERSDGRTEIEDPTMEYRRTSNGLEFETTNGTDVSIDISTAGAVDIDVNGQDIEQVDRTLDVETDGLDFETDGNETKLSTKDPTPVQRRQKSKGDQFALKRTVLDPEKPGRSDLVGNPA